MRKCFLSLVSAVFFIIVSKGTLVLYAQEKPGWKIEWKKTLAAAKKEGQVNVYISDWIAVVDAGVFQKAYPEIKVLGVTGRGSQIPQRVFGERRAGKYLADVASTGSGSMVDFYGRKTLDPIKPDLILPEVVDESRWWQGKHRYVDPEGQYLFRYTYVPSGVSVSYNSNLVNRSELKSLWDFLNPKWKGKITAYDPEAGGPANATMRFLYHNPQLGPGFIRRLFSEMDVTLFRDRRQGVISQLIKSFAALG